METKQRRTFTAEEDRAYVMGCNNAIDTSVAIVRAFLASASDENVKATLRTLAAGIENCKLAA